MSSAIGFITEPAAQSVQVAVKTGPVAWILLTVFLGGVAGVTLAAYWFVRKSMDAHRIAYFLKTGEMRLLSLPAKSNSFELGDSKHVFDTGATQWFFRHFLGWKQPLHVFVEGASIEQKLGKLRTHENKAERVKVVPAIYSGNDVRNSEYLKADQKGELAAKLFAQKTDMAMVVMAGIVGLLLGIIIGYILPIAIAASQSHGTPAANATASGIVVKK